MTNPTLTDHFFKLLTDYSYSVREIEAAISNYIH